MSTENKDAQEKEVKVEEKEKEARPSKKEDNPEKSEPKPQGKTDHGKTEVKEEELDEDTAPVVEKKKHKHKA